MSSSCCFDLWYGIKISSYWPEIDDSFVVDLASPLTKVKCDFNNKKLTYHLLNVCYHVNTLKNVWMAAWYKEFESRSRGSVLDTTLCDKVWQWLAVGRWFSPVSSTNKTDQHDITEILLKVVLNTLTLTFVSNIKSEMRVGSWETTLLLNLLINYIHCTKSEIITLYHLLCIMTETWAVVG